MISLLILIVGATTAVTFNKRRIGLVLLGLSLVLLLLVGSGPIPQIALSGLQTRSQALNVDWKARNWIILLGVGSIQWPQSGLVTSHTLGYSRLFEAARLYFNCKKSADFCRILTTGGDPSKNGISEADTMAHELKEIGVTESDIVVESKSNNTFQNAQFSSTILQSQGFDLALLVTSGVHMSRALLYFSHFMDKPVPAPSEQLSAIFSPIPISHNFTFLDIALHEYTGILRYRLYNSLGWNPSSAKAGSP